MKKTYIEIQAWGDFDVRYTDCIMVSPEELDVEVLTKEFFEQENISSFDGHDDYSERERLDKAFKTFLNKKGFYKLRTHVVLISD